MTDRVAIGNVEVLAMIDMVPPPYDPTEFFPGVSQDAWEPYKQDHLENGHLQLYYGLFALRSQGRIVLVDTGMGPSPHPTRGNRRGDLLDQLKLQGVSPEDVVSVVHTHLHADHVGWNITLEGGQPRATFPRAKYLVPRDDWEHFTEPAVLETAPYVRDSVVPLEGLGVMELIEGEHTITPEISTVPTPGHTPGHINVIISSQGQKGVVVGDVLHSKVQVQEPGWCSRADIDRELGQRSREAMLERAEREDFIVAAGHFKPEDHFGRVIRVEGRRYWQVL
jgi:glyoxylase-like metal-dependent hydrolase (beta-lactamase superfamily II)